MRITIETTVSADEYAKKVVVEVPYDDVDLDSLHQLFSDSAKGFGYNWKDDDDAA